MQNRKKNDGIAGVLLELGSRIDGIIEDLFSSATSGDVFLTEAFRHHMRSGGKKIRPALCLLTCRELGGETEKARYFAAAVEIMHNMFLVHDDLQDGDKVRRDMPAVWVKYGPANAINLGDYMLGRAYTAILNTPVNAEIRCQLAEAFTGTYENTCRGQAMDMNWRGKHEMNVEQYMEMVQLKTAGYLVLGMIGGAVVAGASQPVIASIKELGRFMGPAFQIRDDLIDLTSGKGRGGEIGNDVREGKPSILFAHAVNKAPAEPKKKLLEIIRRPRNQTSSEDVQEVIRIYENCGAVDFANAQAEKLTRQAFRAMESIPVKNKDVFRDVVTFMAERIS